MDRFVIEIKAELGNNGDFHLQRDYLADAAVMLMGFNTLIDFIKTRTVLHKHAESILSQNQPSEDLWRAIGEVIEGDVRKAISSIYEGKLIIHFENTSRFIIMEPVPAMLDRSIDTPTNENVIKGALDSFTEGIDANIGIVRKLVNSEEIRIDSFSAGHSRKNKLSLLYIDGQADMDLVNSIRDNIKKNIQMEACDLQGLAKMLGFPSWNAISKFNTTELPHHAVQNLRKGKVVLFVDRLPFALILPSLFWDMFAIENDRNFPLPLMLAIRLIRIIGILITLITPGLYVALVSVNPEVLQLQLALSVAQSREGVPYPALVEIFFMLLILELILEASVRLPKSIGPTITMVGGIILGQAAVEAKLVSNLLIIILAATTIANSTIVGFQNSVSIRLFKYAIVVLAAIFGILGLVAGLVFVGAYLASLNTYGKSYLYLNLKGNESNGG
ncbi:MULTISPECIES: spore germination protein [Cytobacillus]|uniref:Spore gernimation protein GerA n=2 Tax=Bacillati TaxID=1783272 RepID=A0A160M7Z5_9BACI|nr:MULTISPECIES: spore germination protein [Cytobacillus]MBY0156649.1 spore germination protein [Cytobacillus firmus]AND38373.1 spore gernimation protein GerA [Cytobacillus oceanisediminis 2691]MCM3242062.1 spore germination protein [Cytobacillus oceanisediminis]MCM3391146.1 spore germination protein [Cytobacillus oceanisediminis]MCM3531483.1 spore germination protein [Cytobacillus oceanisediminis]